MNRVIHESTKRPREPILFIDEDGILRRFMQRGDVHETLVVVGLVGVRTFPEWQVTTDRTAWKLAPSE